MNIVKRERQILSYIQKTRDTAIIPLTLNSITELSYKHDPHSPEESKLNLVIEDYLEEQVNRISVQTPFVIELHFTERKDGDRELAEKIIRNNFTRVLTNELERKKKEMKRWRVNLVIGIAFLAVCIFLSQMLRVIHSNDFEQFLQESFSIIGWVALWEPVSYFLYGWREDNDIMNAAIRLRNAEVK